jgi:hypothetical protein
MVSASSLQLGFGGLTPHFGSSKKNYCNQWNNTGIIVNKSYYLRYMVGGIGFTYMRGNDSICSDIEGIFLHYVFQGDDWIEYGVTFGGYAFDEGNWIDHARKTPSGIDAPEPVQVDYFGRTIVPVLALDVGIHLIKRDNWSLKLNNLFTPVIFNHSLALDFRF